MKASYTLVFNRNNRLRKDGTAPVTIVVKIADQRIQIDTGIRIQPEQWDPIRRRIKGNENAPYLNRLLLRKVEELEGYELKQIEQGKILSRESLMRYLHNGNPEYLGDWIREQIERDPSLSPQTRRDHRLTLQKIEEYAGRIRFEDVNDALLRGFDEFLSRTLSVNTRWKHHKNLKKYLSLARRDRFMRENPYEYFQIRREVRGKAFLTFPELRKLETILLPDQRYRQILDRFLFTCYTGLRFSDTLRLRSSHLRETDQGLVLTLDWMKKVRRPLTLPLHLLFNGKGEEIARRYLMERDAPLFGSISNPGYNIALKVIQREAGLQKPLTAHTGRHTFGTLLAMKTGDVFLVMQMMGISKIETAMGYIHLAEMLEGSQRMKGVIWDQE